jgi:hypothetical protein
MYWAGVVLLMFSIAARIVSLPVQTSDYIYFLHKWFDALAHSPGLTAFAHPFADYAPLYLYVLKGLTFLPINSLYSIKGLSILFDVAIAGLGCLILYELGIRTSGRLMLSFAISPCSTVRYGGSQTLSIPPSLSLLSTSFFVNGRFPPQRRSQSRFA